MLELMDAPTRDNDVVEDCRREDVDKPPCCLLFWHDVEVNLHMLEGTNADEHTRDAATVRKERRVCL